MRKLFFIASALTVFAAAPASAQMAPMMGDGMGMTSGRSCVQNGAFVPCPPMGGMQPGMAGGGMAMQQPMAERRMTKREMRMQRKMMKDETM